jgi:purine-cytosine permease-like protein
MKILARYGIKLPQDRRYRIALGWSLVVGGFLGFLPVVGFWMLPLGVVVLSVDLPWVRRQRRRFAVWWERRNNNRRRPKTGSQG